MTTGMRIGEVAAAADVNIQTLRYYERRGLLELPPRAGNGYRQYPPETVSLIRFIKRAQELGFTLKEVEELLRLRGDKTQSRGDIREMTAAKLEDIDLKLRRLTAMRAALSELHDACTCRNKALSCPILEAMDDPAGLDPVG